MNQGAEPLIILCLAPMNGVRFAWSCQAVELPLLKFIKRDLKIALATRRDAEILASTWEVSFYYKNSHQAIPMNLDEYFTLRIRIFLFVTFDWCVD